MTEKMRDFEWAFINLTKISKNAAFVFNYWDLGIACCKQSPSLLRTIQCLQQKIQTYIKQLPAFPS